MRFIGREHSGIDDARNTAKLAYRFVKDGGTLKLTTDLNRYVLVNTV